MARWFTRRWVWATLAGATVTVGMTASRADAESPPKVGSVMSLNVDGKGDHQYKVTKTEKQPDGTYLSELKDTKTGQTLTFLTRTDDTSPASPKTPDLPKAKQRTNDPLLPPLSATMPDPPKEKERRPLLSRIFGDRDKDKSSSTSSSMKPDMPTDSGKKPGVLSRIFGSKKPNTPNTPNVPSASSATRMPSSANMPVAKPSSASPPPVLPTPPGGLHGTTVSSGATPNTPSAAPPLFPSTTPEPPRVMPNTKPESVALPMPPITAPVTPPTIPTPTPAPVTIPSQTPLPPVATPTPMPVAAPTIPAVPTAPPVPTVPVPSVPSVPPIPAPTGGNGLPPIPIPPGGTSLAQPIQVVVPVGFIPAQVAFDRDVEPWVLSLQSMNAPSARITAAKALAEGRHRSTDGVKAALFQAAQMDPCGDVRAACITHLCELGYFHPQFIGYIQVACQDTDSAVRDAAKTACGKMIRK